MMIVLHRSLYGSLCSFLILVACLSTGDDFSLPLLISCFRFFEDVHKMLAGTDCLSRLVYDSNRLNESRHVGGWLLQR